MIRVAVANQKGGVAKTTTSVTVAHGLALKNFTTLLVDLDPQGQCSSHLGLARRDGVFDLLVSGPELADVVEGTGREELWLLPGGKRTRTAESLMTVERRAVDTLGRLIGERVNGGLHFLIMDTAPSAGGLQENALFCCDVLIVPSAVDHLSLEGVREVLRTLKAVGRSRPPVVRILPTFFDQVTRESRTNLGALRDTFGEMVLEPVHRAAVLRECPALGKTIFEHRPESRAADEYARVVWALLELAG